MAQAYDLATLVRASATGDQDAWNELVRRYAGMVAIIARGYRLSPADAQDVCQLVWLRLVEHLTQIREPAALPGWLATTTRHECQRHLRTNSRSVSVDPVLMARMDDSNDEDIAETVLAAERRQALLDGLAELAPQQRALLILLTADPPPPYAEISRTLGMPMGSIGPMRSRALDKLRETAAIRTYLRADNDARTGGARHAVAALD